MISFEPLGSSNWLKSTSITARWTFHELELFQKILPFKNPSKKNVYYYIYLTRLHIIQLQSHDAHGHDEEQDYYGKAGSSLSCREGHLRPKMRMIIKSTRPVLSPISRYFFFTKLTTILEDILFRQTVLAGPGQQSAFWSLSHAILSL